MWMIEVNVLGHRFTHTVNDRPEVRRLAPHLPQWRQWKPRNPRAAA
jgi:hypothetical protein